jgi:hypothetical protein
LNNSNIGNIDIHLIYLGAIQSWFGDEELAFFKCEVSAVALEGWNFLFKDTTIISLNKNGWFESSLDRISVPITEYKVRHFGFRKIRIFHTSVKNKRMYTWWVTFPDSEQAQHWFWTFSQWQSREE